MSYGIIQAGKLVNIVEATAEFAAQRGWPEVPAGYGIGDLYSGGKFTKPVAPQPSKAERKTQMLNAIDAKRKQVETGGITRNGMFLKTDRETNAILTSAYVLAKEDPNYSIQNWKVAEGVFVTLDAATIIATSQAVRAHVQASFDHEAYLTGQIMAADTHADLDAIEIDAGWPQ